MDNKHIDWMHLHPELILIHLYTLCEAPQEFLDNYRSLSCVNKILYEEAINIYIKIKCDIRQYASPLDALISMRYTCINNKYKKNRLLNIATKYLESSTVNLNTPIQQSRTSSQFFLLSKAVSFGDKKIAKLLLMHGADPFQTITQNNHPYFSYKLNAFYFQRQYQNLCHKELYTLCQQTQEPEGWFKDMWNQIKKEKINDASSPQFADIAVITDK